MNARFLMVLFDAAHLLALSFWVGGVAFLAFALTPAVTGVLGPDAAARLLRVLYPRCYTWAATAAAVALPAYVAVPMCFPELRGPGVGLHALAILAGALLLLYAANAAGRPDAVPVPGRASALPRGAVVLNALVLAFGVGLVVAFAARPLPRSSGIIEPSPGERARRALERLSPARDPGPGRPSPGGGPSR